MGVSTSVGIGDQTDDHLFIALADELIPTEEEREGPV